MCAHFLVDGVLNVMIVSDALDMALPQQSERLEGVALPQQSGEPTDAYSQEITDAQISSEEYIQARNGTENPDLDEVDVLYSLYTCDGGISACREGMWCLCGAYIVPMWCS